jgi:hypothetical protein
MTGIWVSPQLGLMELGEAAVIAWDQRRGILRGGVLEAL